MNSEQTNHFEPEAFKQNVLHHLKTTYSQEIEHASSRSWYLAMVRALSEMSVADMVDTAQDPRVRNAKHVNYLSLEFLMGRLTGNALINMNLYAQVEHVMQMLGQSLSDLLEYERDPSLGNGGLGRLAACFMDSCAAQQYPTVGYGLHYEYGLFKQSFVAGRQQEAPDEWRGEEGYPWERLRPELTQRVGLFGHVETEQQQGKTKRRWKPAQTVKAMAWDIPIIGYKSRTVYPLRLWECRAEQGFSLDKFNEGAYIEAQQSMIEAANLTKVLYPNDNHEQGKVLRLMQQYFHSAASIGDIVARHEQAGRDWESLPDYETIQLNDTHPAIAIPELMRVLIDEKDLAWQTAWSICTRVFAYTNHTLMPEALETWRKSLMTKLLPRHMELITEIDRHVLKQVVQRWPDDTEKQAKLAIISTEKEPMVRMANLCVVGSYAVNGVAAMHTELVQKELFPEFNSLFPNRIRNVTNGITPRRWLTYCNPDLANLIRHKIGHRWEDNLDHLVDLAAYADKPEFQSAFMATKKANKERLAQWVSAHLGLEINPDALFDVQIKRLHEYKRQHLNLLHILSLYHRLLHEPDFDMVPRVVFFAAKAAPGYHLAKEIIYAINQVATTINQDDRVNDKLKVVFIPDYRVSIAELIIPAADLSEQISTAGKEASGTGNMKLALNGALTIGTMDGANVEIREEVGDENIFIFGLNVHQVNQCLREGYDPHRYYTADPLLKASLDWLNTDYFTPGEPHGLKPVFDTLLRDGDPYLCLADFRSYVDAQTAVDRQYRDVQGWARKAILNTALVGKFSSDRSIRDYVETIWHLQPVKR
ncbi:Maltodextrin phosphorylase [Vibrio ruber DSM 16370]|uniref:Alpha-1,4 glucan phosphorylase n=1 Tax=Vibrio ruber (strain DSM 16370 / JCM 11486 / BCRC 17186 / CECT 7878 / LMG 23124 / VR1) TaxID=1123498 RepID=A0A1R4LAU6_VIBR1|nr:glycogen/starch/alpha-glucan phosphorylase [Vibrio ruber]SJN53507.1 Maltodextrin phosphorylase [Vibrio ruber DSM 16370]